MSGTKKQQPEAPSLGMSFALLPTVKNPNRKFLACSIDGQQMTNGTRTGGLGKDFFLSLAQVMRRCAANPAAAEAAVEHLLALHAEVSTQRAAAPTFPEGAKVF